ncbi:MAG: hypothetical protein IJ689_01070 [Alphaproteobacteria bacterium]|nr:hypothetical protein [Alphaproteobacteria bacterium]
MTNKTFLILLLVGVSYTAYNAAAVSENFAISTTIDHEIVLGNFRTASTDAGLKTDRDMDLGTITINPSYVFDDDWMQWSDIVYNSSGNVTEITHAVTHADNIKFGRFSANIPNPTACNGSSHRCGGLSLDNYYMRVGTPISCENLKIYYLSDQTFEIRPEYCTLTGIPKAQSYQGTINISYSE